MHQAKKIIKRLPIVRPIARSVFLMAKRAAFRGSLDFWERNYARGGTSGAGSYGKFAEFKAEILNMFVREHTIHSVIEFGCGDGNQLSLAEYPGYVGLDVARSAIKLCKERFQADTSKSFFLYDPECFIDNRSIFRADLALSLEVIFHIVEDRIFALYMRHLFLAAEKYVIIYSSDSDMNDLIQEPDVRHRCFSKWVEAHMPDWRLVQKIPNRYPLSDQREPGSYSEFFIYERNEQRS